VCHVLDDILQAIWALCPAPLAPEGWQVLHKQRVAQIVASQNSIGAVIFPLIGAPAVSEGTEIAVFLNDYLRLGNRERDVNFRSMAVASQTAKNR
jgi:hypothetical protein